MSGLLCLSVSLSAILFVFLAFGVAVIETVILLKAKREALDKAQQSREQIKVDTFLEALAKVLAALKDLPAWVAIFLAAMALVWTVTSAPHLCT